MTRSAAPHVMARRAFRSTLLKGTSIAAVAVMLSSMPAHAQLAAMRQALGVPANVGPQAPAPGNTVTTVTPTMNQILARHHSYEARVKQAAGLVSEANAAARAAAAAAAKSVPDGLRPGGLDPITLNLTSAQDPTGLSVWEGAAKPTESQNGTSVNVTVNQTQSRALLSWNSFNVGANTTLTFNQQGNANWIAVNRVVGNIDPNTGLLGNDPSPTQILGSIKADGSVYILDRAGVMFGASSQVNLHSLLVSSLELGSATVPDVGGTLRTISLRERNDSFLARGLLPEAVSGLVSAVADEQHGDVTVGRGAQISSSGGYVILAAPKVSSAGEIKTSVGGQVSLEAGTQVDATISSGAAGSPDPYVRGLVLSSLGGGSVEVTGSIDAPQGYISLGTDLTGSITMGGVLTSTTSVSRNGKISLIGGTVNVGEGAAMAINPDLGGATIPQSADSVAAFKTSQIDIGSHLYVTQNGRITPGSGTLAFALLPANITIGKNSIISAPSANVSIGGRAGGPTSNIEDFLAFPDFEPKVEVADGAIIDVSGIADLPLDASRNLLVIDPAKRNELRDTPNYRDPSTDGSFTLNGQTLYIDPRLSGVRSDGVAWIGSPLIEAGSLASQVGITAPELMTKGGNVVLATAGFLAPPATGAHIPSVNIASNAIIDFSGGWVHYAAGSANYSKLVTEDGRVIDIAQADPNDNYIAVGGGFVEHLPQLADPIVHANLILAGATSQPSYIEGRDAGSLTIKAPTGNFNGEFHGDAVAGARQIGAGQAASLASTLTGDLRRLQAVGNQLPSAGLLHVQSIPGADIIVGAAGGESTPGTISIESDTINTANLGAVSLQTSGKVTIDASADIQLAPGGAFNVDAGRTITFNGDISVPSGSISARTYGVKLGNIFDTADDLPFDGVLTSDQAPRMFDIVVNDGATLSARGRWVNDSLADDEMLEGPGYTSGGSITLISAPHVAAYKAGGIGAVDLSGSILLKSGSLLDVSGGGYVSPNGAAALTGKGGNVSLINETSYFQKQAVSPTDTGVPTGDQLFRSDLTTFQLSGDPFHVPAVIPDAINATVEINGEIRSFGFKGGGTFSLVTPDLNFGAHEGEDGTAIGLDFLADTGFATLSLTSWKTAFLDNVFNNGVVGKTGLLATDAVQIRAGETLDLTQSILPSVLSTEQLNAVLAQETGADISRLAEIAPTNQLGDYENRAAHLILGGMTELQILGGTIIGAPQASITAPKIYNAGTIRIAGGSIFQKLTLPSSYVGSATSREAIGVHQLLDGNGIDRGAGLSVVFGEADADGKYDEFAPNALGIADGFNGPTLSNRDLVAYFGKDRQIYYLGLLEADEGIVFAEGSTTDLSGTSILNPRAPLLPGTQTPIATGRIVNGGTIKAASLFVPPTGLNLFTPPGFSEAPYTYFTGVDGFRPIGAVPALKIIAGDGALIDLSGASDTFDVLTGANSYTPTAVWSHAGSLSALGGGDISKAVIDAHGGAENARGGTLEWLNPVLVQSSGTDSGVVSADQIETAGFDSFIARGHLTTIGDVNLTLDGSFLLRARDYSGAQLSLVGSSIGDTKPFADPYYAISMGATGDLSITAAHVGLLGIDQVINSLAGAEGEVGTLALHGGSIDIFGAVAFRNSLTSVLLDSDNDIRLIGVQPLAMTLTPAIATNAPSLSGQVIAGGNLTFRAAQVYATTGSGNLQRLIETNGQEIVRPFLIGSAGADATVRFERNGDATPPIPYSAGSYISVLAAHIEHAGVLRAPLGRIDLGSTASFSQRAVGGSSITISPTQSVTLENGSLTSVSLGDRKVPYGTTTDLTEYFFAPGSSSPLTAPPAAELRFGGDAISVLDGATVDASGGTGDIYAYEFVSGTGGSRDVLSRFNNDQFSSNNGFQFADGRQVYAIVPAGTDVSALYDPIYSADYGALYSTDIGKMVRLEGGNGIPAGEYLLLPAQYAMLPGAMRLVENVGSAAPLAGASAALRDGSIIVAGTYGSRGTDASDWDRRSFTVQSQEVFRKYSRIELTSGTTGFTDLAKGDGNAVPRLPADAARMVFNPALSLIINGNFETEPEEGGRGSQVDIAAEVIDVVGSVLTPREGALTLVAGDLEKLNAASLFLGGIRTDLADGSTDLAITAHEINILTDIDHPLTALEILLAVDGIDDPATEANEAAVLNIADGASIVASGTLTDTRSGDYNVAKFTRDGAGNFVSANSGAGAVFRLANGVERLVNRSGDLAAQATTRPVTYNVGAVHLSGDALAIDTSRQLDFDAASTLDVKHIALSGDNISFSSRTFGITGLVITPELEQAFAVAESLTLRANATIGFTSGEHNFNDLTLYAPGVRLIRTQSEGQDPLTVILNADNIVFGNKTADAGACRGTGAFSCGTQGNSFVVNADTMTFASGVFRTYGFDSAVGLNAANGAYYNGVGAFDVGAADLTLTTPFLVDRGNGALPRDNDPQADLELRTTGNIDLVGGSSAAVPIGAVSPGSRLAIGSLSSPAANVTIDGVLLRATAGTIEAYSSTDVTLSGDTRLETPSYSQSFGDAADKVTVSANGGTISLVALTGDITLGDAASLMIGGATGSAGTLNLFASQGEIELLGTINAAAPGKGASLGYDAGQSAFDLTAFLVGWGANFTGDLDIRTGLGDLELDAGQTLNAESVTLTADGGSTIIGGTINTSGVNGGDIALFARDNVNLLSTAVLDAHANGYAETDTRRATGGDVTLGVGEHGAIDVAAGATINVAAVRPGDRLVAETRTDPRTLNKVTAYTYVEGDQGGTLTLRAPVIEQAGSDTVDIDFAGNLTGASDVSIEGYKAYDLAEIAADPSFTGVTIDPLTGIATLDLGAHVDGRDNFLAELGSGTIVDFIQNFDISAVRSRLGSLASLEAYHERPGVELGYAGDITLASNWNLGAGKVDIAAAVAAGDMRLSALGPYTDGPYAGQPRYEVVPGREAHLFQNFVTMTYRVGGTVDGEAGVLTLRAGGDLNINHSITDGFFAFGDHTDPAFISHQLGGGERLFNPALTVRCSVGEATCDSVTDFVFGEITPNAAAVNFNLTNVVRGEERQDGIAPYSEAANSPAAFGLFPGGAGDPIGSATIFPLLADGTPVDSFSIQLVGGAGASSSANPLHIDRASGGNVIVSGETTYNVQAGPRSGHYLSSLQLRYQAGPGDNRFIGDNFLETLSLFTELDQETLSDKAARVAFGAAQPAAVQFMRDEAAAFFAEYPGQVQFIGPVNAPTAFIAPVGLVLAFLESTDASGVSLANRFAARVADGTFGYNPPATNAPIDPAGAFARVRTLVRTGIGSIDLAAAANVDLTNGDPKLLSPSGQGAAGFASNAAQAGGSSIYTIGHLAAPAMVSARISGIQNSLTIDPSNYLLPADVRDPLWVPNASGRLQTNPVYGTGGGSIRVTAGQDVLGRRDVWSEAFNSNKPGPFVRDGVNHFPADNDIVGSADQRWRVGSIGTDQDGRNEFATNIRVNPQLFSSGIGTLGGGDISIEAGHDVSELTVALDTSVTTGDVGDSFGSMVFGGGNLKMSAGHDILGGRFHIASGTAEIEAGRDIKSSGQMILRPEVGVPVPSLRVDNLTEIRLTDATVDVMAGGSVQIGKVSALGVDSSDASTDQEGAILNTIDVNALGYYTGRSGVAVQATGNISIAGETTPFWRLYDFGLGTYLGTVMPASLEVTSFKGDIVLGRTPRVGSILTETKTPLLMYPGATGQLSLLAGGTLAEVTIALDDGDASLMPGIFSALNLNTSGVPILFAGRPFSLPIILPDTTDFEKRLYHADTPVHAGDDNPVRIAVGGDLVNTTLLLSKAARISAGGDIVNMMFVGQNVGTDDVTRIVAGRDIKATVAGVATNNSNLNEVIGRSIFQGNRFILGGPGSLFVEAGRNLGPFLGSSTFVDNRTSSVKRVSQPGGILSVGNDLNPNLATQSADIYAFFGVANGMDFEALRETYVNPANADALDDDLFEQVSDPFGNKSPDRTKPVYSPILIAWMKENQAEALMAAFGTTEVDATQAYTAFASLPDLVQREFLLKEVYFNELAAPSRPDGPSYLQYVRGYRAVNSLFSPELGYTENDLSGAGNGGTRVNTGNLDLRLATIQTTRGGDVTILGPGGDAILGSVVRTSAQAAKRAYQPAILDGFDRGPDFRPRPEGTAITLPVFDIPIGFEGVLTLRGGAIYGFTDGDFRLNQSRLFSQQGGHITLWSSNGDLNAGQGPKSAANVPPIVVRFDPNGTAEVDSAGAVTGAGIAGFTGVRRLNPFTGEYELVDAFIDNDFGEVQALLAELPSGSEVQVNGKTYLKDAPTITLIAPVGTVDAGDAGVRAGGDVFVAAARVANADNFKVGGHSVGVPSVGGATAPPTPAAAASALTANLFRATNPSGDGDQQVRILVDVLGFSGSGGDETRSCPPDSTDPTCRVQ